MDRDKVIRGLEDISDYFYNLYRDEDDRKEYAKHYDRMAVVDKAIELLKAWEEEQNRLVTWLAKFNRHIDNGDKWLPYDENLEFYKKKMSQQFGWDTGKI